MYHTTCLWIFMYFSLFFSISYPYISVHPLSIFYSQYISIHVTFVSTTSYFLFLYCPLDQSVLSEDFGNPSLPVLNRYFRGLPVDLTLTWSFLSLYFFVLSSPSGISSTGLFHLGHVFLLFLHQPLQVSCVVYFLKGKRDWLVVLGNVLGLLPLRNFFFYLFISICSFWRD